MFKVELIGNLGSDAQVKNDGGNAFVTFSVAHTDKWKDADGKEHDSTQWVDCILNNVESAIIPFLKAGVKVFVRGNARLRVYSSKKDRCMKAGVSVWVQEVELCGGSSDAVPRELIVPEDASIFAVQKFYWVALDTKGMKKDETRQLIDRQGRNYAMNAQGFVFECPESQDEACQESGK